MVETRAGRVQVAHLEQPELSLHCFQMFRVEVRDKQDSVADDSEIL